VVHLHWIPGLLGIADLPAIARPVLWTFHDQWPICGAEHYSDLARQRTGYEAENRAPGARGPDLDRWVWRRKRAHWQAFAPLIVCPSRWLAAEARASALFRDRQIEVVPYPLDTSLYSPQDRAAVRLRLGLPPDRTLLLFAAFRATSDARKGFGVLAEALRRLSERGLASAADLVVCGATDEGRVHGFATHWLGQVDGALMREPLSACDLLVVPSLQDNLPNVLLEGMACGLPAVGSDIGGIPDLVQPMQTGLLAAPGDAAQLAQHLELLLRDAALRSRMGEQARRTIEQTCGEQAIGERYAQLYRAAAASYMAR
jgi:glycosyltransferase involved in cell wall biosynthesis